MNQIFRSTRKLFVTNSILFQGNRMKCYAGRESRMLSKMLGLSKKKNQHRPEWFEEFSIVRTDTPVLSSKKAKSAAKRVSRRSAVLNSLFMKNVTDLLANNSLGRSIIGYGVEITQVNVCQGFGVLNIFWFASKEGVNNDIEEKLANIAGPLRHELSQLRLMGEVPRIQFVKDREVMLSRDVDRLLEIADYGEDYELTYGTKAKNKFKTEANETTDMRNDIFGLDRNAIMNRIMSSLQKTKDAWRAYENVSSTSPKTLPSTLKSSSIDSIRMENAKNKQSEEAMEKFLVNRKFARKFERQKYANTLSYVDAIEEEKDYESDYDDSDTESSLDGHKIK